ncbi:hypothetical protein [Cellulomonas marina]|uniref:Uncharacterized protein n=1 Tax=Cellulomonas marina TaxID=988821 RepID=A0A1I0WCT4_9CELL|nr:hypothetical protein [Cellulomonas marina]GIG29065.1 hypothetical protein Cma02nite_16650 [Cellulomonas marina]SFA85716.1 hypothetical protein SAMN05421867_102317 [Cellulomonas marina]
MRIGLALRELHRDETELADELLHLSERHAVDHEVYHLARDLAGWSADHVRRIAEIAGRYGEDLDPDAVGESGTAKRVRERVSDALDRSAPPGMALLRDLRTVYTMAQGVSVDWELLAQAAQGIRHHDLLDLTQHCHPENLRQARWANAKLKESATQVLVS